MKLTAKIKRKVDPIAKLIRQLQSRKHPIIIIDPMSDSALLPKLRRLFGKRGDFLQVTVTPKSPITFNPFELGNEEEVVSNLLKILDNPLWENSVKRN